MGACDTGRCCKGGACSNTKKCCCKGTFTAGEVCRSASCQQGGSCADNVPVCQCLAAGGTLTQTCDPCLNYPCAKCQKCELSFSGTPRCVSLCTQCQDCDTSTPSGTCVPKTCNPPCAGACQVCNCGTCMTTGIDCNGVCCSLSECCVDGECVACDCGNILKPGPCYECQNGQYVPIPGNPCGLVCCEPGKYCCAGQCSECSNNSHCTGVNQVCVNCVCKTFEVCFINNQQCNEFGDVPNVLQAFSAQNCVSSTQGNCVVIATPKTCDDIKCLYQWDGSQWAYLNTGGIYTGWIQDTVGGGVGWLSWGYQTPCSCAGCPPTFSAAAPAEAFAITAGPTCTGNPLP